MRKKKENSTRAPAPPWRARRRGIAVAGDQDARHSVPARRGRQPRASGADTCPVLKTTSCFGDEVEDPPDRIGEGTGLRDREGGLDVLASAPLHPRRAGCGASAARRSGPPARPVSVAEGHGHGIGRHPPAGGSRMMPPNTSTPRWRQLRHRQRRQPELLAKLSIRPSPRMPGGRGLSDGLEDVDAPRVDVGTGVDVAVHRAAQERRPGLRAARGFRLVGLHGFGPTTPRFQASGQVSAGNRLS